MSSVPQDNRFAPPAARVEDLAAESGARELAGRGARFGALVIDLILMGVAYGLASALLLPDLVEMSRVGAINLFALLGYQFLIGFVLFLLLNGWLLATRGQTLGKMALKVRIVRPDGSQAGFVRLFLVRYVANNLLCMVPLLGMVYALADCLAIFRDSRRCLHDSIADTIVVKA